jgi:hypothetical protein
MSLVLNNADAVTPSAVRPPSDDATPLDALRTSDVERSSDAVTERISTSSPLELNTRLDAP